MMCKIIKKDKVKKHQRRADQLIYKLYSLTSEEIKFIEDS